MTSEAERAVRDLEAASAVGNIELRMQSRYCKMKLQSEMHKQEKRKSDFQYHQSVILKLKVKQLDVVTRDLRSELPLK